MFLRSDPSSTDMRAPMVCMLDMLFHLLRASSSLASKIGFL